MMNILENPVTKNPEPNPAPDKLDKNFSYAPESYRLLFRGVPVGDMLAFPVGLAAQLMGVCYNTLWREVKRKRIKMTPLKLIPRAELDRYLAAEAETPKRKKPVSA